MTEQTTHEPFDPVSLEIMWSRLIHVSEECWLTIRRTAFSLIIGETQDFGVELLDATGNSLAHSPRSMPVFNLALPRAAKALLAEFGEDELEPGDVLVTNDPWLCAGHLFDVALVTPVFKDGRLVGHTASVAHCSDIGGTRDSLSVREIYEEGLQIPPMKFHRAGVPNEDLIRLIRRNVRAGDMVMGDLQAQISANEVGARRLLAFMDEYGLDDLTELAHVVQNRAEKAMRDAIRSIPDGTYHHTIHFDSVGTPLRFTAHVHVRGDALHVDWDAPPQVDQGAINSTMNYTSSHTAYALKCVLTPDIPSNSGCYDPITTSAPDGSVLNCRYPAGVNARTNTGWFVGPALFGALADVLPDRVQAFTGLPVIVGAYGSDEDGTYNDYLFQGGGQGAGALSDGNSGLLFPTSAGNTSIEMFEVRTPMLVDEKRFLPDSGGAGRHRGGLGQAVVVRKLKDDGRPAQVTALGYNVESAVPGLHGGGSGTLPSVRLVASGEVVEGSAMRGIGELRAPEDRIEARLSGGSGFGDPRERDVALLQRDLDEGYVSEAGLARYGARLDVDGRVTRGGSAVDDA